MGERWRCEGEERGTNEGRWQRLKSSYFICLEGYICVAVEGVLMALVKRSDVCSSCPFTSANSLERVKYI